MFVCCVYMENGQTCQHSSANIKILEVVRLGCPSSENHSLEVTSIYLVILKLEGNLPLARHIRRGT